MKKLFAVLFLLVFIPMPGVTEEDPLLGVKPEDYITGRISKNEVHSRYIPIVCGKKSEKFVAFVIYAGFLNCEEFAKPNDTLSVFFFWTDKNKRYFSVATTTVRKLNAARRMNITVTAIIESPLIVTIESLEASR